MADRGIRAYAYIDCLDVWDWDCIRLNSDHRVLSVFAKEREGTNPMEPNQGNRYPMKYLFFDTESANCYGNLYKMCEWGSLMTDEDFNVIPDTKCDVLFNPGRDGKFSLTGRKDGRDVVLAHPYEAYQSAMLFCDYYEIIRVLVCQKDRPVFLWASDNDIQALLDQCFRYKLPKIPFISYDVQKLFMTACPEEKRIPSLEKAMELLGLSMEGLTPHRPDDDALMTSMVLKEICKRTEKTVWQLIEECPQCRKASIPYYYVMKGRAKERWERRQRAEESRKAAELARVQSE